MYLLRIIGDRRVLEIKRTGNNALRWVVADAPTMVIFPQSREYVPISRIAVNRLLIYGTVGLSRTKRTVNMFYRNPQLIRLGIFIFIYLFNCLYIYSILWLAFEKKNPF